MPLPERLGKYSVVEVLGKGAMGVVYKAFDPHIRRTVALKVIRKEIIDDDQSATLIARFKNEAQAAGRLTHPGIVAVYEYGEDEAVAYIAMEYVQGKGLREYFQRGTRFGMGDVVSIMAQLLDALAYAHEQGVIHRDIKPANIIIMGNGKLKVADFGIAHVDSSKLTHLGTIMGTPGYMAPEQYSGAAVDRRADIFSAGVVLYQLLTGVKPFTGTTETIAYKSCYEPHVDPSRVAPELASTPFDGVVAKALAKKPEERFRTSGELRGAIMDAYSEPVSPVVSEETIINGASPPAVPSTTRPPQSQTDSAPGVTTVPPPGWDAEVLRVIEQQLMRYLGPVAKVIVRRGARSTTELETLYALLAESLATAEEKRAFMSGRQQPSGGAPAQPEKPSSAPVEEEKASSPPTAQEIDNASRRLATYLGPIARVVAKKAAAGATSRRQFHLLLAEQLGSEEDKERFLKAVGER